MTHATETQAGGLDPGLSQNGYGLAHIDLNVEGRCRGIVVVVVTVLLSCFSGVMRDLDIFLLPVVHYANILPVPHVLTT